MWNPVSRLADIRDKPFDPIFNVVILRGSDFQSASALGACFKMLEGNLDADNLRVHNRYEMTVSALVSLESVSEIQFSVAADL